MLYPFFRLSIVNTLAASVVIKRIIINLGPVVQNNSKKKGALARHSFLFEGGENYFVF